MKTKKFWSTLMVLAFVAFPAVTFTSCGGDDDDSPITPTNKTEGVENGHEWVDLGLSVKWATCNVGATKPEGYGDYFAWGETKPKSSYTKENYTYIGRMAVLPSFADAASVNWGGKWRMPTKAEIEEILDTKNCSWKWTSRNGVNGCLVTSIKNNKSIFLPAAGIFELSSLLYSGEGCDYWTSSLYNESSLDPDACYLWIDSEYYYKYGSEEVSGWDHYYRWKGFPVRAVCPK